jgi:hypothetical protein
MTVLHEFHLIVLALVSFAKLEPDKQNQTPFRFVENSSEGIAGNVLPIVHTAPAFNPTAQEAAHEPA